MADNEVRSVWDAETQEQSKIFHVRTQPEGMRVTLSMAIRCSLWVVMWVLCRFHIILTEVFSCWS